MKWMDLFKTELKGRDNIEGSDCKGSSFQVLI